MRTLLDFAKPQDKDGSDMPSCKAKPHKGLTKRVRITGRNKVTHKRRGTSHRNSFSTGQKKRELDGKITVHETVAKKMQKALHTRLIGRKDNATE